LEHRGEANGVDEKWQGAQSAKREDFSGRKTETQFEEEKDWEGQLFVS
jgi:hypothetical protein